MKIAEITEGYANTDEGFADAWSTVKKGAEDLGRLGTGAAVRQVKDMGRGAAAKMGFAGPAQAQKMQRIAGGVAKNFKAWTTQRGLQQDVEAVQQYLSAVGFNPADVKVSAGNTSWAESKEAEIQENRAAMLAKNAARVAAPAKQKAVAPDVKNAKGFQGAGDAKPLNRNELIKTIADTIQSAIKNNRVPKAIEKFTKI